MGTGRPKFVLGNGSTLSIDEVRITKGIARYTANYVIATDRFPGGVAKVPTDHIAHYTMDTIVGDTLKDEKGSYDATITDAVPISGLIGDALSFNGYTSKALTSARVATDADFSVSLWFKLAAKDATSGSWLICNRSQASGTTEQEWQLNFSSDGAFELRFGIWNTAGGFFNCLSGLINPPLDTWIHAVAVRLGNTINVYINAVSGTPMAISGPYQIGATTTAMGTQSWPLGVNNFNGALDLVRIYDRALTQSEIDALYTEGSLVNGLKARYTMDNISGTTLFDETGNHDAVLTGTTQVVGHLGNALSFTNTTDYATISGGFGLTSSFSFSFWVKVTDVTLQKPVIANWNTNNFNYLIDIYQSNIRWLVSNGNSTPNGLVVLPVLVGTLYHVVASFNATNGEIKLTLNAYNTITGNSGLTTVANATTWLAHKGDTSTVKLDGWIDQFRVYSRLLSQTEIDALYYEEILTKILAGTITETLGVTNWHVRTYRIDNGILTGTIDTTDGTFSIDVGFNNGVPHMITVTPDQGAPWTRSTTKIVGSLCYPTDPNATPYYYKSLSIGTTGATEPVWVTTPGLTVVDGGVTWECVERLVQPITQSPLIPV